jgi:2-phospho-L-lactate guanylyltransferase|tara:strand:- start:124 stop:789 length:666 start_codon:yes stop_codon:yes gene_type:complete
LSQVEAAGTASKLAAVVPMKPLHESKSRLSDELSEPERAALSLNLFRIVLAAATASKLGRVIVLGGDNDVRLLAEGFGAEWTADVNRGLNAELGVAFDELSTTGWASMYLPGDLPLITATDIDAAIDASRNGTLLAMCPATRDGGTNGLIVPSRSPFRPELGEDSFARHKKAALSAGLPFATCDALGFSLDLDTIDDLLACERIEPGFRMRILTPGGDATP